MGGNNPSRCSVEDEEGGGVTFIKGIRLSDRVINRMKLSSKASYHLSPEPQTREGARIPAPSAEQLLPLLTPSPPTIPTPPTPTQEAVPIPPPVKLTPPPPVRFHSLPLTSLDSASTPPSASSLKTENSEASESLTPPSAEGPIAPPPESTSANKETQTTPQIKEEIKKPFIIAPSREPADPPKSAATSSPQSQTIEVSTSFESQPVKPVTSDRALARSSPSEAQAAPAAELHSSSSPSPPDPSADGSAPSCQSEMVHSHKPGNVQLQASPPNAPAGQPDTAPPPAAVVEEDLRRRIRAELQKSLEEEISQRRLELQHQLEEIQALTRAEATVAAHAEAVEQVKNTLEAEKALHLEKLTASMATEKRQAEDEKLRLQLYAEQLEEKEKEMKKQD
ncbi:coiled-coil-helix-coiled-coil-helix domain containing 3b [Cyprinodon tularosa]|uniref:coiled-coil-helix-coiled-coil-helix domain containing 3b n=1 Tax=Cyprinodon tularosa TaxID=77115 RepID=UPI0018E28A44|nr:coiled-coil-helix-coiled-coil-helix domain containing 3b [Cyprinodon tularosa]